MTFGYWLTELDVAGFQDLAMDPSTPAHKAHASEKVTKAFSLDSLEERTYYAAIPLTAPDGPSAAVVRVLRVGPRICGRVCLPSPRWLCVGLCDSLNPPLSVSREYLFPRASMLEVRVLRVPPANRASVPACVLWCVARCH